MPPELSISADEAQAPRSPRLDEVVYVAEIAAIGFIATITACVLGLTGLDALLAIFFSTTLAGQFFTAVLNRMRASSAAPQGAKK